MNAKQYEFVMQYLQHKDKITAYTIAYNKRTSNYRAVESAANRLLQNPEIKQYIATMRESMYNEAMQEVQKDLKTELLTVQRKREVLARIVNGEHSVIQNFKGKNCQVCTYFLYPTIREILQGIREDNRMAGHYPSPAVASAKAGKNAKAPAGINARYIDSIPRLAQTPLPAGLARFAQNEDDISQHPTNITPQPVSPLQGDRGKTTEGNSEDDISQSRKYGTTNNKRKSPSGGQLAAETPDVQNPQHPTTNIKLSPSGGKGVSAAADEGGTFAQDAPVTQNPQHPATITPQPVSPRHLSSQRLEGDRGKTGEGNSEGDFSQQTTPPLLGGVGVGISRVGHSHPLPDFAAKNQITRLKLLNLQSAKDKTRNG